jgi:hypothetical protein
MNEAITKQEELMTLVSLLAIPNHGSSCVRFGSGHVGLSGLKSWPAPDPSHVRVGSGFGVLVIIFGSGRVGLGYFLSSGENFGLRPTRHTVGSGRVFSGGSGRVHRVGQPMIRYIAC